MQINPQEWILNTYLILCKYITDHGLIDLLLENECANVVILVNDLMYLLP